MPYNFNQAIMKKLSDIPFSVLDLAPINVGSTPSESFRNSLSLAQHAERLGYKRYWLAEHQNMTRIASAATSELLEELRFFFRRPVENQQVQAVPRAGMNIQIWLLGSSGFSARLAGQLGLPFAFAGHFSPEYICRHSNFTARHSKRSPI